MLGMSIQPFHPEIDSTKFLQRSFSQAACCGFERLHAPICENLRDFPIDEAHNCNNFDYFI